MTCSPYLFLLPFLLLFVIFQPKPRVSGFKATGGSPYVSAIKPSISSLLFFASVFRLFLPRAIRSCALVYSANSKGIPPFGTSGTGRRQTYHHLLRRARLPPLPTDFQDEGPVLLGSSTTRRRNHPRVHPRSFAEVSSSVWRRQSTMRSVNESLQLQYLDVVR